MIVLITTTLKACSYPYCYCQDTIMCVHPLNIGYDELRRDIYETKFNHDMTDTCDYIELDKDINTDPEDLTILNLNIRGLYSKLGKLNHLIDNVTKRQADVITLSETWLSKYTPHFNIAGYKIYRKDRVGKKGGGVAILVSTALHSRAIDIERTNESLEICGVQVKTNKGQLGIFSMYRPPNTNAGTFVQNFVKTIKKIKNCCKEVIIGLDHNMDFLKSHVHVPTNEFLEEILNVGLLPTISRPTRITKNTATLIDNILIDHKHGEQFESYVVIDDTSDHLPCLTIVKNVLMNKHTKIKIESRDTRDKNLKLLKARLRDTDWDKLLDTENVNEMTKNFHAKLCEEIERFCPKTVRNINYSKLRREPWIMTGILKCIKKAKTLYKETLVDKCTEGAIMKYKRYNCMLQRVKRQAKRSYYFDKCNEFRSNTKKLWQTINSLCGKQNDKTNVVTCLKINNIRNYNANAIANEFSSHFASVGKMYADKIPKSTQSIDTYLSKMQSNKGSIFLQPTNPEEIKRLIGKLPNKGSSGFDQIDNILLKKLELEVATQISKIANASISQGIFPELMKNALIVPLYKSQSRELVTNYRPISLLITISKLLEKIVYKQVYDYLNQTGQIHDSQYGFRSAHSCEHAIGELLGNIVKNIQLGKDTVTLMLDLSKAFDTLQHSVVYKKLERYGLRGNCLAWFQSYLSNRTLQVKCISIAGTETISNKENVEYGTPQGSCMGPLLFLIFCNDLHLNLQFLESVQFADDTTLYISHRNMNYTKFCLTMDLEAIEDWFRANKLTLNIDKTVLLHFGPGNKHKEILNDLKIGGKCLQVATSSKFLGLWIDNKLRWSEHVNKLLLKLQSRKSLLMRGKYLLTVHAKKVLYFAQIQSNLTYGLLIWGPMISAEEQKKITKLQDKCVDLIDTRLSKTETYKTYKILPFQKLIELEMYKIWHKCYLNLLPTKLIGLMKEDHNKLNLEKQHSYNTRKKKELNLPFATSAVYKNSFYVKGSKLYGELPPEIKEKKNYSHFVNHCKKYLNQ